MAKRKRIKKEPDSLNFDTETGMPLKPLGKLDPKENALILSKLEAKLASIKEEINKIKNSSIENLEREPKLLEETKNEINNNDPKNQETILTRDFVNNSGVKVKEVTFDSPCLKFTTTTELKPLTQEEVKNFFSEHGVDYKLFEPLFPQFKDNSNNNNHELSGESFTEDVDH